MILSHEWPRMSGAQKEKIEACLTNGCHCGSLSATLRRRLARATVSIWLQCDVCGAALSSALPRADHFGWQDYFLWNETLRDQYDKLRKAEFQAGRKGRQADYAEFLASDEWRQMARRVMVRAAGKCECCLNAAPSEVHHVHYLNGWMPPAWDLRAVCRACHLNFKPADDVDMGQSKP